MTVETHTSPAEPDNEPDVPYARVSLWTSGDDDLLREASVSLTGDAATDPDQWAAAVLMAAHAAAGMLSAKHTTALRRAIIDGRRPQGTEQ